MSKLITNIVIQRGYAVFGTGGSEHEALEDAGNWLCDPETGNQGGLSPDQVEGMLRENGHKVHGDLDLIDSDDPEFDSIADNGGGITLQILGGESDYQCYFQSAGGQQSG